MNESRPVPDVTAREMQILKLLVKGLSNKQIAAELDLSVDTVKTHIRRILSKLNARGRTQAAVIARTTGLTPGTDD